MIEIVAECVKAAGVSNDSSLMTATYRLYEVFPNQCVPITRLLQAIDNGVPAKLADLGQPIAPAELAVIAGELATTSGMNSGNAMQVTQVWADALVAATHRRSKLVLALNYVRKCVAAAIGCAVHIALWPFRVRERLVVFAVFGGDYLAMTFL
jgi:hypothetical protein